MADAASNWPAGDSFTPTSGFVADAVFQSEAGFVADTSFEKGNDFTGGFSNENISKHANDDLPTDGGCRICDSLAHFARDCPDKLPNTGECYNCGESGHNKADCPNPRVEREFTGTCHVCEQTGHRAVDCPSKPPAVCKICRGEGHTVAECSINRLMAFYSIADEISDAEAWTNLCEADKDKDLDDIKRALLVYGKSISGVTFPEIETAFRQMNMNTYLIAKEQEIALTHTLVNLQGQPGQKFVVSFQFSPKPRRLRQDEGWPSTAEENMIRLSEAGCIMDSFVPKCDNCSEAGHTRAKCTQEKREPEKVAIMCSVCDMEGHRARDCRQPRKAPGGDRACKNCGEVGHLVRECPTKEPDTCRNCGEEGHRAKDCTKERVMTCRNCDQEGHMSKDCPEPKNMAKMQCRNCDEYGHGSRDCPKPTDWSRVECTNCHEKGHSYKRCPKPAVEADDAGGDGGW